MRMGEWIRGVRGGTRGREGVRGGYNGAKGCEDG